MCLYHWICGHAAHASRVARNGAVAQKPGLHGRELSVALYEIWQEQRGRCAITGTPLSPGANAVLDHILPVSRGGSSSRDNLRFVHEAVNNMKRAMTDDEFAFVLLSSGPALVAWGNRVVGARVATALFRPGIPPKSDAPPVLVLDVL